MTEGFAISQSDGGHLGWVDGEASFWASVTASFGRKIVKLRSRRCSECGVVEFIADESSKPVKTLKSVDEENERLRKLVTALQQRVETLETIATDPAERTAREIEGLRTLPPLKSGSSE
jgi:Lon protease-like protein